MSASPSDERMARHEPRRVSPRPPRPIAHAVRALVAELRDAGLRPIVDSDLEAVHADCPSCRAGERDPLNLYRPLTVAPRRNGTRMRCSACGGEARV